MRCSASIPGMTLALRTELWTRVRQSILAPDYRKTRSIGFLNEPAIPNITLSIPTYYPIRGRDCLVYLFDTQLRHKHFHVAFSHYCERCLGTDIRLHLSEGVAVCATCGTSITYEPPLAAPNQAQSTQVPRNYNCRPYKRLNHFRHWLMRLQGKEYNKVTSKVLSRVKDDLQKHRADSTYDNIRVSLRRLHLQRFYNNAYYIQRQLIGHGLFDMSRQDSDRLLRMFMQIQEPFHRHAAARVNMFSYSYIIRKMTEVLGWDDVASVIPHLKSRAKVYEQDLIWRKICCDVGYPFYPSV